MIHLHWSPGEHLKGVATEIVILVYPFAWDAIIYGIGKMKTHSLYGKFIFKKFVIFIKV